MTAISGQDSINVAVSGIKKIPDYKMRRPAYDVIRQSFQTKILIFHHVFTRFSARLNEQFTMGNSSFRCWAAGHRASKENGPPAEMRKCKNMEEAIKQANEYVGKNYKDGFCTVGSDCFLQCWKLKKECKAKFEKTSQNIFLCYYHGELSLDDETKAEIDNDGKQKKYDWTYLYYEK
jgi:hypothetical protein